MTTYPDAYIDGVYTNARKVAVLAIEKAITRRRQACGDHTLPRVRVQHTDFVRVTGGLGSAYRVWARKGVEEFEVVSFGISRAIVRSANDDLADDLPNPLLLKLGRF